jgi:hypothetical protein
VPGKLFQTNLMFARKAGAYPSVGNLKGASLARFQPYSQTLF